MNKTKVLVTGVFDILHEEHLVFLHKAKKLGDYLLVGVESDVRVKQTKGENRPINLQALRVKNLENLRIANQVFILPEKFNQAEDHLALIKKIKPNVLAVSSHTPHLAEKRKIMSLAGGKLVVIHQHNPQISSTKIINSSIGKKILD